MYPEEFLRREPDYEIGEAHDSILPMLREVTPRTRNVGAVVRVLSELIARTHLQQFASRTQKQYLEMLRRIGTKRVNRFSKMTRYWVHEAKAKLQRDVAAESKRLKEAASVDAKLGGSHSNAL